MHGFFATNAKMVLINDDQCGIADIVLGVWLKVKKLNYPSIHKYTDKKKSNFFNSQDRY